MIFHKWNNFTNECMKCEKILLNKLILLNNKKATQLIDGIVAK